MITRLTTSVMAAFWFAVSLEAQAPKIEWTKAIGGTGNERANGITTDLKGNIVVVGRFQSPTLKIDKLTLTKTIRDNEDVADVFIIKLDKKGKALWAITAGDFGDDHALSCITDKVGNIYVVGWFESETLKFGDIELRNYNFVREREKSRYNSDMWVAKFSPKGTCIWAKNAGGLDGNGQYSTITLDKQNNVLVAGIAGEVMDFGSGVKLTNEKGGAYVAKYTNNGKLLWAKSSANGEFQGITVDDNSNIYCGGFFRKKTSIDAFELTSKGDSDAYIVKLDPNGKVIWAKNFGGDDNEIASCQTDAHGNVYLAGLFFSKTISTDKGTLINKGFVNAFIAKFDKDGKLIWTKSAGGNNGDEPATVFREFYVDNQGNAFCTGSNWSEFTFAGNTINTVANSEDIVLLKYDKDGRELWGLDYGGRGRNAGRGVVVDRKGTIFLAGSFDESQLKLDNHLLTNVGSSDIFIVKFTERSK